MAIFGPTSQYVQVDAGVDGVGRDALVDPGVCGCGPLDQEVAGGLLALLGNHADAAAIGVVRDNLLKSNFKIKFPTFGYACAAFTRKNTTCCGS